MKIPFQCRVDGIPCIPTAAGYDKFGIKASRVIQATDEYEDFIGCYARLVQDRITATGTKAMTNRITVVGKSVEKFEFAG